MKYRTIVIDPPWKIHIRFNGTIVNDGFAKRTESGLQPYQTMTDKELLEWKLPVEIDDNAVMFMWVVNSKIQLGIKLLENYGFTLKRLMAWQKLTGYNRDKGIPISWPQLNGFNSNSEFILFGKRGKNILDCHKPIKTIFEARVTGHSKKPTEFYDMIKQSTPDPRIDIFARKRHEGFNAYGDQVE